MALLKSAGIKKVNLDFNQEFINTFSDNIKLRNVDFINQYYSNKLYICTYTSNISIQNSFLYICIVNNDLFIIKTFDHKQLLTTCWWSLSTSSHGVLWGSGVLIEARKKKGVDATILQQGSTLPCPSIM